MKKAWIISLCLTCALALPINIHLVNGDIETQESVEISSGIYCSFLSDEFGCKQITLADSTESLPILLTDSKSRLVLFKATDTGTNTLLGTHQAFPQKVTTKQGDIGFLQGIERRIGGYITPFPLYHAYGESLDSMRKGEGFYKDGALVGVYYRRVPGLKNTGYLFPSQVIYKALKDLKETQKSSQAYLGLLLDSNNYLPVVVSVRPNSPAEQAGVKQGDVITQLNGKAVESYEAFASNVFFLRPESTVNIQVARGGELVEISAKPVQHPYFK